MCSIIDRNKLYIGDFSKKHDWFSTKKQMEKGLKGEKEEEQEVKEVE